MEVSLSPSLPPLPATGLTSGAKVPDEPISPLLAPADGPTPFVVRSDHVICIVVIRLIPDSGISPADGVSPCEALAGWARPLGPSPPGQGEGDLRLARASSTVLCSSLAEGRPAPAGGLSAREALAGWVRPLAPLTSRGESWRAGKRSCHSIP